MSEVATLYFTWEQIGPLHSGYGYNLAQALGKIERGARKSAQLGTHMGIGRTQAGLSILVGQGRLPLGLGLAGGAHRPRAGGHELRHL